MSTPLAIAAISIGIAIQLNNGALTLGALALVTVAYVCCLVAVTLPTFRAIECWDDEPAMVVIGFGLALQVGYILTSPAGIYLRGAPDSYDRHHYAVAAAAILAGAGLARRPWLGRLRMPLLLAVYVVLGRWLIQESPNPHIDVFEWHRESFRLLADRQNPYAASMPNIYGFSTWYADGLATNSRVSVGFPYPPLSLFLSWLGQRFGDYRYALLGANTLSAAFMAYARRGRLSESIAALFLLTPRGLFVLEQGWTEPLVVLFLSATVFCACRKPRLVSLALGLFLAIKQYAVLLLPLAPATLMRGASRKKYVETILKAGSLALVLTLPMALWDVRSFVNSVVVFQGKQPFRGDALSYLAWSARNGAPLLPLWVNFVAVLLMLGLSLWRAPRTPAGFAASGAIVFLAFFSFAKQAFCNYYFMTLGVICCAVAALRPRATPT